ncbi:MAG TPA: shikimate dehydrogenase [Opitutus sp.]|nr:shikimate dehydrogenase [Opitutus sp.]
MPGAPRAASLENLKAKTDNSGVLTLADLEAWSFDGTPLAVLGQPIKHSISPAMHNAALAAMAQRDARFATWKYFRFEIAPTDLGRALPLLHAKRFRGINLTVPHKVIAVDHIADISPAAKQIGAVNTLLWTEAGWQGHNTDGYGLATGTREDLHVALSRTHIVLLGAGGAARGAAVECLLAGCASLAIANRTRENLDALLASLRPLAGTIPLRGFAPGEPPPDLPAGALVVNATSAGLRDTDPMPVNLDALPTPAGVYDMIYNPPETTLLRAAKTLGLPCANGLSMLVHQGAKALEIWSGTPADVNAPIMAAAVRTALGR